MSPLSEKKLVEPGCKPSSLQPRPDECHLEIQHPGRQTPHALVFLARGSAMGCSSIGWMAPGLGFVLRQDSFSHPGPTAVAAAAAAPRPLLPDLAAAITLPQLWHAPPPATAGVPPASRAGPLLPAATALPC